MTAWSARENAVLDAWVGRRADVARLAPLLPGRSPDAIKTQLRKRRRAAGVRIQGHLEAAAIGAGDDRRRERARNARADAAYLAAVARHHPERIAA